MGKIKFKGGVSSKDFEIVEESSGEVKIKNSSDGIDLLKADSTSITDASGIRLSSHGSRHGFTNASDKIDIKFSSQQTVSVSAGGTWTISAGMYIVRCGANTTVEYTPDGGTNWYVWIPAGGVGLIVSDGSSVRFNNSGGASENSYLTPVS